MTILNPYAPGGTQYKGQIHFHSTGSDGLDAPAVIVQRYVDLGYDFVSLTDHNVITADPEVAGVLFIPGCEDYSTIPSHGNQIGAVTSNFNLTGQGFVDASVADGSYCQFNHPKYGSLSLSAETLLGITGYHGLEVLNGRDNQNCEDIWDALLTAGRTVWGSMGDDCHDISTDDDGLTAVYVFAASLTQANIVASLKAGNFYASSGPTITVDVTGDVATVTTPDPANIKWISSTGKTVKVDNNVTSSSAVIEQYYPYLRAKITRISDSTFALTQPFINDSPAGETYRQTKSHIKAVWRLEQGRLNRDSSGNGNLLVESGSPTDSSDYREGRGAGDFDYTQNQGLYIQDVDLCEGFPLKNGDTVKKISGAFWFKPRSFWGVQYLGFNKFSNISGDKSFGFRIDATGRPIVHFGYTNGTLQQNISLFSTLTLDVWYHLGYSYDDETRTFYAQLYSMATGATSVENRTITNNISITGASVCLSGIKAITGTVGATFDGLLDGVVVSSEILTPAELTAIRRGEYQFHSLPGFGSLQYPGRVKYNLQGSGPYYWPSGPEIIAILGVDNAIYDAAGNGIEFATVELARAALDSLADDIYLFAGPKGEALYSVDTSDKADKINRYLGNSPTQDPYGPEKWGTGTIELDAGWTDNGDGTYTCDGTDGREVFIRSIFPTGVTAHFVFEIIAVTAGSVRALLNGTNTYLNEKGTVGTHEVDMTDTALSTKTGIRSRNFAGTVRVVSIKQVL